MISKQDFLKKFFSVTKNDILCNTSYPFIPNFFEQYKSNQDIMRFEKDICIYIHIPFCKNLCKFCEYTRFIKEDNSIEKRYLNILERQIVEYEKVHNIGTIYGIDVGGGTPTVLSHNNFDLLMQIVSNISQKYSKPHNFESSIEFSVFTIDEDKIKSISQAGFRRVSTGIQTDNINLLTENKREAVELNRLMKVNETLKKCGISKLNIDIMYGLPNQTVEMCNTTMDAIEILKPEQVTLYETRYNMNGLNRTYVNRKTFFEQYYIMFQRLQKMGYSARFGQNTFTTGNDEGVSSYLNYRMNKGMAYKGFGISAQSMSKLGISYNSLKSSKEIRMPKIDKIDDQYVYILPPEEIAAKYVCIALYSAKFSLDILSNIIGFSALDYYADVFDFLQQGDYIFINDDDCFLTSKGFMYYGAVASMFWSNVHQYQYLSLMGG